MSSDLFKPKGDLEKHIKNLTDNWEVNQKIRERRKYLQTKDLKFLFFVNTPYDVFRKVALEKHLDLSLDYVQLAINCYPRMNYRLGYQDKKVMIKRHKSYDDLARFHEITHTFKKRYNPSHHTTANSAQKIELHLNRQIQLEDVLDDIDYTLPKLFEKPRITISKIFLKDTQPHDLARSSMPFNLLATGYRKIKYL